MKRTATIILLLCASMVSHGQPYSDGQYRRAAILNGNQVRTVFGNWGVIGQPEQVGKRGAWKDDNNGYLGDVSPLVGAEVRMRDTTFRAVIFSPVARPQADPRSEDPVTNKPWSFEPVPGYFAGPPNQSVAVSNNFRTWPDQWPDKLGDPGDPGWRGSWNGYFGKRVSADLETYFVMDDQNFERFSDSANNARRIRFRPDSLRPDRKGLGLEIRVRGLQWAQFLAQDNIFWLYEITNTGTTNYDRMVFGMLVGTYVGVTSTENAGEYNDDWSFYDVRENITYSGDFGRDTRANPRWNQRFRVGMVGYAFLESPGNPFDGIDNDGDADSSSVGIGAPVFGPGRFDSTTITPGMRIVLIQDDFTRTLYTVPNVDTVTVYTRGRTVLLRPGVTRVAEGNEIFRDGQFSVNINAYDGVDNDFDGLIDENYYLHYRQIKRGPSGPPLIDILRPVRYIDAQTGAGTNPLSMIDEKRNDLVDNDNDWSRDARTGETLFDPEGNLLDDVGRDGIQGTNDAGERDGQPTSGYLASGFDTGLPGEANIDKTDVNESDQIGLSSFNYFTPAGDVSLGNDEVLWRDLAPGVFSVPLSIVNNRPESGEDGDFTYSSGYFPLLAGATERFSLALVYGGGKGGSIENDIADLLKNKRTVQQIYDANYQFPTPPDKPTLTAVPGDRQVTLYWDRRAEISVDPVLKYNDFEGYKIYKSTDPNFSDVFTITDGSGTPRGYAPIAQYDIVNGVQGYFQATGELFEAAQGYNIFLGEDTGLRHTFVDRDVDNGRTYYYAIVAYDRGDDAIKIFPSENTRQITVLATGEIFTDINVVAVVPNSKSAGYVAPGTGVPLRTIRSAGTGGVQYSVVDPTRVTGNTYEVTFLDTRVDGVDNNDNGLVDEADSTEWDRRTSYYFVRDMTVYTERFRPLDTILVPLRRKNLEAASVELRNAQGVVIQPSAYVVEPLLGAVRAASSGSLPADSCSISYRYYPVHRSPFIKGSPFATETADADIFDGVELDFSNAWSVQLSNPDSLWRRLDGLAPYIVNYSPLDLEIAPGQSLVGFRDPTDFEVHFGNGIVDTSIADPLLAPDPVPVNFRIFDATEGRYVDFVFADFPDAAQNRLSPGDDIVLFRERSNGSRVYSWNLRLNARLNDSTDYQFVDGDRLVLKTTKSFRDGDLLEFTTVKPRIEAATRSDRSSQLDRIRAVPNPYVTASAFEPPLPPGVAGGRGQRKIDFTNLPAGATVKIFTARGEHLITLEHDGAIEDGTVSWNLRTKENLDIAYGIYFYVVESSIGNRTGKIAIIK